MSSLDDFLGEPRNVIVVGIRKDGRPHASPNWYGWDGERFYVSTTRGRAKYKIFSRDPRVELCFDDPESFRYVALSGTVEILEDIRAELPRFRAIREKHGRPVPADEQLATELEAEGRVLLAITPNGPSATWTTFNFG
jgi:PPOX class probable F420-dependent enzyme